MYFDLPENQLQRVRPDQIEFYLTSTGWSRSNVIPGRCSIYHNITGGSGEVVVPLDTKFSDYLRRVADAVRDIAAVSHRPLQTILREILAPYMDLLAYRLEGPSTRDYQLSLIEGVDLYQSALSTLRAAAHDQISPSRFHRRLTRREAYRYIGACRLGVPCEGSFVSNIYCPADLDSLQEEQATGSLFQDPAEALDRNFARRVTLRALRSMAAGVHAIEHGRIEELIPLSSGNEAPEENIISANFFEALGEVRFPDPMDTLTVSVQWGAGVAVPPDVPTQIVIEPDYPAIFRDIALRLRPMVDSQTEVIEGRVATLSGDLGDGNLMEGEVIIEGTTSKSEYVRFRVDLNDRDYIVACDAHKEAKVIKISGTLTRGKRLHTLAPYLTFRVRDNSRRRSQKNTM